MGSIYSNNYNWNSIYLGLLKMILKDTEITEFKEMLYHSKCPICKNRIYWKAIFDADGTDYVAKCCDLNFQANPTQYRINIEKLND